MRGRRRTGTLLRVENATGELVPLLPQLERSRAESELDDFRATALVRFALTCWSDYWADRALDWVVDGAVETEAVADSLAACSQRKEWPQNVRHRAARLWKGTRRYEAAMLLRRIALAPPPSDAATAAFEESLQPLHDLPGVDDLLAVLVAYSPLDTRERGIAGPDELSAAARDALHDLGDHALCRHAAQPL